MTVILEILRGMWITIKRLSIGLTALVVVPIALVIGILVLIYVPLPGSLPAVSNPAPPSEQATLIYDASGGLIARIRGRSQSVPIKVNQVPPSLRDAVIASEDRNFFTNNGVDLKSIVRAAKADTVTGHAVQGGSTITEQYVKMVYSTPDVRNVPTKLYEAILATRVARTLSKPKLLANYLNIVYFGDGAYGVGAAALDYFGVTVQQLTPSQAATLVGLIPAPTARNPRLNPALADQLRQVVLSEMHDQHYITDTVYNTSIPEHIYLTGCKGQPICAPSHSGPDPGCIASRCVTGLAAGGTTPPPVSTPVIPPLGIDLGPYPYFTSEVMTWLGQHYTHDQIFNGGLRVHTTLNINDQTAAQNAVNAGLSGTGPPLASSLVSVDPNTGFYTSWIGGSDFNKDQVDLASGGTEGFQAGSSFKAYVLAQALIEGIKPTDTYIAYTQYQIPGCTGNGCIIHNDEGEGTNAPMTLADATTLSVNTVFIQLILQVGIQKVAALANAMGVTSISPTGHYGASLALGAYGISPADMAAGYSVLADQGMKHPATPVQYVTDITGKVLLDQRNIPGVQVIPPAVAATEDQMLSQVIQSGTGKQANIGRPAAGKTGTTDGPVAAWFVGYTPQVATAVWIGDQDKPRPLVNIKGIPQVYGGTLPAQIWANYMSTVLAPLPPLGFPDPATLPDTIAPPTPAAGPPPTVVAPPAPDIVTPGPSQPLISVVPDCNGQSCSNVPNH